MTGIGALGGAFWGLLVGLIFLIPVVGLVIGTVSGGIAGHFAKNGITKEFMQQIQAAIQAGQSALFILAENVKVDRVVPMVQTFHPKVLRTSLTTEQENNLKEAFGGATTPAPTMTV